jgi:hypothetical protein
MIPDSNEIACGKLDLEDVIQPTHDEINKKHGLKKKQNHVRLHSRSIKYTRFGGFILALVTGP